MKIGLVLSGGGDKGAYQVGAWKALEEFGISKEIKVISGTSIGALNTVFFDTLSADDLIEKWLNINMIETFQVNKDRIDKLIKDITNSSKGIFDKIFSIFSSQGFLLKDGVIKTIKNNTDLNLIPESKRILYATCTDCTDLPNEFLLLNTLNLKIGRPKYFKLNDFNANKLEKILVASAAIPFIFDRVTIDGREYLDGGLADSTPIPPAYYNGCDIIIVISLNKNYSVDQSKFPLSKFITINLNDENKLPVGNLTFERSIIENRIDKGYSDMKKALKSNSFLK